MGRSCEPEGRGGRGLWVGGVALLVGCGLWRGESCSIDLPALLAQGVAPGGGPSSAGGGSAPPGAEGLVARWPLDGSWAGAPGPDLAPFREGGFAAHDLLPVAGQRAYGPTGQVGGNGAQAAGLTAVDTSRGITLAGWYLKPDNNTAGTLFGFGDHDWGQPSLGVYDGWGYLYVGGGQTTDRYRAQYDRPTSGCWHHLAAVFPPGFEAGTPFHFFIDGIEATPVDGAPAVLPGTGLFGSPFRIGTFWNESGGRMRVDEVSLWDRALAPEEIVAAAQASGERCPGATEGWEPGPRCTFPGVDRPRVAATLEVRVLTDSTLAVITDPTHWLLGLMDEGCGRYLGAMERRAALLKRWWTQRQYEYAFMETKARYWPGLLSALTRADHFSIGEGGQAPRGVTANHWPQAVRELSLPRAGGGAGEVRTLQAEVVWVSYLQLPSPMLPGRRYTVGDAWGNAAELDFDEDHTISWALKVDQVGYLPDASKHAYLGMWMAQAGALDLARFDGAPFAVVASPGGEVVHQGRIRHRMEDLAHEGESVWEMDLSAVETPGDYYVRVPGVGRSWGFRVGQEALGEAFYVHARGLYHQRCGASLTEPYTRWTRGDVHRTWRGAFPPDGADYDDHTAEGWGFRDEDGGFVELSVFDAVAASATTELLPEVVGGWHDAADYDRRPQHFRAVQDLLVAWLMFPDNFTDGQLGLPESGNGIPDIVDEARWGVEVWRRAQRPDGGVGTAIEATSHPEAFDPGADPQPYYLSLATRSSSLDYARYAALLGRVLARSGAPGEAEAFLQSARRAYAFGTDPSVRVSASWEVGGRRVSWTEAPRPDEGRRLWALVELWLGTGDPAYRAALGVAGMDALYHGEIRELWWKNEIFRAVAVALEPERFPTGWGPAASAAIVERAEEWLRHQHGHAYRRVWWSPTHPYFDLSRWGNDGFAPLRTLVAAWRLTGDRRFREAALEGVSYLHGANGRGWVGTTGLGSHRAVVALHLPSWADDIEEPVPGLTLFGNHASIPWPAATQVFGLRAEARWDPPFLGVDLALMPPPWRGEDLSSAEVTAALEATIPKWRRLMPLEQSLPSDMELSVWETVSPAAAVTGCLMGPGWRPSPELQRRAPLPADRVRTMAWMMP